MASIKKNDTVMVIAGEHKGESGDVIKVIPAKSQVVVSGINIGKRNEKPSQTNQTGGIVEKEMPIHISNVMVVEGGKPTRVRRNREQGKASVRVSVKSGNVLD